MNLEGAAHVLNGVARAQVGARSMMGYQIGELDSGDFAEYKKSKKI